MAVQPEPEEELAPEPSPILIGDGELRGRLALDTMHERDGRLVAALAGGGEAVLTLDPRAQKAAEDMLERAQAPLGAVVAMSIDGRILAYAGRRNKEPQHERDWDLPARVWAPAASVFKIVTGAALVAAGVEPSRRVCYHGGIRSVDPSHLEDHPRDNQCDDLTFGIARSQNAIMGKLAHRYLNVDTLNDYAHRFGFGDAPELAIEADPARAAIPEEPLEFARVAAGFWHTEISTLSGAVLANVVASGGLRVNPRIVDRVIEPSGFEREVVGMAPVRTLDESVARQVGRMLVDTTVTGTARRSFHDNRGRPFFQGIQVAGKTGTLTRREPSHLGYSWFVGFAPADDPQVAIAVLLGNPPEWHLRGHTAARIVLQALL
jgi:penicillin-binding protein A